MEESEKTKVTERCQIEQQMLGAELLDRYPIADYVGYFDTAPGYGGYGRVPSQAAAQCAAIERDHGREILASYHRFVLLTLIGQYDEKAAARNYPPEVLSCCAAYLRGIVPQMARNPAGFYLHGNDQFAKDFAVCRRKLVPCGAQLVDVRSGVAMRVAGRQSPWGILRFLGYMLGRVGGFRVLYEMHMDPRLILEFNPRGWERCYMRIAKLLERHPDVLGVCGSSWWFDPALQDVSPRLDFLRDLPRNGGGRFFPVGSDAITVNNALANSRERQQAYERGAYRPMGWLLVWSRSDLIAWSAERAG